MGEVAFSEKFGNQERGSIQWCACFNTYNSVMKSFVNTIPTKVERIKMDF